MATAKEVFEALIEKAGFEVDNESKNWTKNTFAWKNIAPGKVYIYFQTGTGKEYDTPNFGFCREDGLTEREVKDIKVELHNIVGGDPEDDRAFVYVNVKNLGDRSVEWALRTMEELERRILFRLSQ